MEIENTLTEKKRKKIKIKIKREDLEVGLD